MTVREVPHNPKNTIHKWVVSITVNIGSRKQSEEQIDDQTIWASVSVCTARLISALLNKQAHGCLFPVTESSFCHVPSCMKPMMVVTVAISSMRKRNIRIVCMSAICGPLIHAATLLHVLVLRPLARSTEHMAILTFAEQFHQHFRKAEMGKI